MTWIKSSFSYSNSNCVELASLPAGVMMRDSKNPDAPLLAFTAGEFAAFLAGVKAGEFDGLLNGIPLDDV